MTQLLIVLAIALALAIPVTAGILLRHRSIVRPCYRCRTVATTDYMGVHYCMMCSMVVSTTMPAVRHDPPFGFPGSNGYLDFPEEKKEG